MSTDYTFFYVEANVVCMIIFSILLFKNIHSVDRQEKQLIYDRVLLFSILYFACDCFWAMQLGGVVHNCRRVVLLVNFGNNTLMAFMTFYWFLYVEVSQRAKYMVIKRNRLYTKSLAIASTILMGFFCVFHSDMILTEDGQVTLLYAGIFLASPLIYILIAVAKSFVRSTYPQNYAERTQYITGAVYPLVVSISGVVQTLFLNAPLFCFGITIMMIYVYISSLEDIVSQDPLTSLNNRAQLKRYLSNDLRPAEGDEKIYVFMIDLNKFKSINDTYGHIEGDKAIVKAAEGLKLACAIEKHRHFIARYGGDEFIIVAKLNDDGEAEYLKERLKECIYTHNKESGAKYDLRAAIGYAVYSGKIADFAAATKKADDALYEDKHWVEPNLTSVV